MLRRNPLLPRCIAFWTDRMDEIPVQSGGESASRGVVRATGVGPGRRQERCDDA